MFPLEKDLLSIMTNTEKAEIANLPKTGLPLAYELALSPIFVDTPTYATLVTTIVTVNNEGLTRITEFQHNTDGTHTRRSYETKLQMETPSAPLPSAPLPSKL